MNYRIVYDGMAFRIERKILFFFWRIEHGKLDIGEFSKPLMFVTFDEAMKWFKYAKTLSK